LSPEREATTGTPSYASKNVLHMSEQLLLLEPAPWGTQVPLLAGTSAMVLPRNTCFGRSMVLYNTFPEQTAWYPWLGMG